MAEENRLTAAERDLCEREKERLNMAARFASLAATVEHRTRGHISLRRLTPTHPQYARCMRAATENLKPGFFSDDSPYSALRVLDVYKVHAIAVFNSSGAAFARKNRGIRLECTREVDLTTVETW